VQVKKALLADRAGNGGLPLNVSQDDILDFVNHHESDPETLRAFAIAVIGKLGKQCEVKALALLSARARDSTAIQFTYHVLPHYPCQPKSKKTPFPIPPERVPGTKPSAFPLAHAAKAE
jgi:hypothetical protein